MIFSVCAVVCSSGRLFIPGILRVLLAATTKVCVASEKAVHPQLSVNPGWLSASLSSPAFASRPWLGLGAGSRAGVRGYRRVKCTLSLEACHPRARKVLVARVSPLLMALGL